MSAFIKLIPQDLVIDAAANIVKREQYSVLLDAQALTAQAQIRAEQIIADAEAAKQQAYEDGYNQGVAAAEKTQAQAVLATLKMCQDFMSARQQALCDLVGSVTNKLLGNIDRDSLIISLVEQALSTYHHAQRVTLYVAPSQFSELSKRINQVSKTSSALSQLEIKEDERVEVGACLMETPIGVLNIRLDAQLAALENGLGDDTFNLASRSIDSD